MKKRLLSAFLVLAMVLTLLPSAAFAVEGDAGKVEKDTASVISGDGKASLTKTVTKVEGANNTFQIELKATTSDSTETTPAETSDIVLVIDASGSMDRDNRINTAKSEAIKFADQVLDPTSGTGNRVAVVSFDGNIGSEPDYTTQCGLSANLDAVSSAINGIITGGGTNIQAGIMEARRLLQNSTADNQVIILLSDGEPQKSYRPVGTGVWENCGPLHGPLSGSLGHWSWTGFDYTREVGGAGASYTDMTSGYLGTVVATCIHGNQRDFLGSSPYPNHGEPTIAEAKIAKDAGYEIYTVYLRDPKDDDSAAEHAQYTLSKVASEGDGHYLTPAEVSDLAEAFESIAQSVLVPTEAGSVTDTMGEYVTLDLATISDKANVAISDDGSKSFTWNLTNVEPVVNEETGTKTYTLTYQVTLNTEQEGYENGNPYATNGDASFTYTIKDTSSTITIPGADSPLVSGGPVTKTITVKFVDKDNKEVGTDEMTVNASATEIALNDIELPTNPKFLRLMDGNPENLTIKDGQVTVFVERYVGVNYWDIENNVQAGEGKVTVPADATEVDTSKLTDVPEGYEIVNLGDVDINDGWISVDVKPVATVQTVVVNFVAEGNEKVGTDEMTVNASATEIALNDIELPTNPKFLRLTDGNPENLTIKDGQVTVFVERYVGVNYWDIENNVQAGEGKVTVPADATKVNTSKLTDVPEGYEIVNLGDVDINDGWISVDVKPVATVQTVVVNFVAEGNEKVGTDEMTVDASATEIALNDIELPTNPKFLRLMDGNPENLTIKDGQVTVFVERYVGVNYWDIENNVQAGEGKVTVPADATKVNTSKLTDVPEGYEIVNLGDVDINDGWISVDVKPVATVQTVVVNFVAEGNEKVGTDEMTVDASATEIALNDIELPTNPKFLRLMDGNPENLTIKDGQVTVFVERYVGVNYWDIENNVQAGEGKVTVPADATKVNTSKLTDVPEGYEIVNLGDVDINDGWISVDVKPVATVQTVVVNFVAEGNEKVGTDEMTVDASATEIALNDIELPTNPKFLRLMDGNPENLTIKDGQVTVFVERYVGVNYWDIENNVQAGEGKVTVPADATKVNTSKLTDVPEGYEIVNLGDVDINDGWISVDVKPVATVQTVVVNFVAEGNEKVGTDEMTVDASATEIALNDIELPTNPKFLRLMDGNPENLTIKDGQVTVFVERYVGVNYWDIENNVQAGEGKVTVPANADKVNTSKLTDVPKGYEIVNLGDVDIHDGWIFVEVRPAAETPDTKEVGVNYWDIVNNKQAGEGKVTVAADAYNVNSSQLTDIPEGYELVRVGDFTIYDGWIFVEVRPAGVKTVGVNYWDIDNNCQVKESSVVVDADAIHVNSSALTDIPAGYELVWTGDYRIYDGWIFVELRLKDSGMKTIGVNYWDIVNDKQAGEGSVIVDADATAVNTTTLTDVPAGYEVVWLGDVQINDGWIFVEVRPAEDSKTVGLNYWDIVNDKQVAEGSLTVDADATLVNTSTFIDIPKGYELVWTGDLPIVDGWVWVEVRPVEDTKTVGLNYWDIVNDKQVAEGSLTVDADATLVNTSTFTDIPKGYELVWTGDLPIVDGWVWVEVRPAEDSKTVGLNYWDIVNDKQVAEGSLTVDADATLVNTSTFTDIPKGYELVWTGDLPIVDGWVWVEVRPVEDTKTVGLNYWDIVNDKQVAEGSLTVDADATLVNTSTFTDIPKGYELVWTGDLPIVDGWVWVEVRPVEDTKTVGLNYWDIVNDKQVAEGSLTVDADATLVNTSTFTDIPKGYELVWTGDLPIVDGWVWVEVRPAEDSKTVGLNYWDIVNDKQVAEGSLTVDADATLVNTSTFTDIPKGYELVWTGDLPIVDGWVWVEVRPAEDSKTVGLNYWDIVNDKQVAEGSLTVDADATLVNTSTFTDIPKGYELVWTGDLPIVDGWVWVEVRPVEDTKTVGLNYWDIVNDKQVAEGSLTVDADATLVNTSTFTDIPKGYELVWTGDLPIVDGWVWVEVRPAEDSKTVGLNYWDIVNDKQVAEGSLTVDADATLVNTSTFTDIPKGYELVWTGDLPIVDGWVWVEVRPVEDTPVEKLLLTYDANYGSNPETKVIGYEAGETAIIKGDLFGRKNYTFTGWNTDPDGDGKSYDRGDKLEMDEDITLYAQWKRVDNDDDNDRPSTGTRYTIDASASLGGDISPEGRVFVARGNDRTFRITADEGYVIDDVRVDGESVGAVRTYTFENVRRDHTIEVIFVPDGQQTVVYGPDDTGVSDWLNVDDHVSYLNGYPGGLFGPNDNMTRAEVAQMFYNLLLNQNVTVTVSFADVSADAWYAQAVNALASLGIVQGVGDGMFAPERTITRAEFTVIAMRFAELPTGGTNPFSDVRTSDWFYAQVVGAAQYGWITGYTNGTFGPNNTITRAEVTAIVNRMLSRSADEDFVDDNAAELVRFNDVSDTYWAYYDIMEATNSHEYEWDNNAEEWTDLA